MTSGFCRMKKSILWLTVSIGLMAPIGSFARSAAAPNLASVTPSTRLVTDAQYINSLQAIFGQGLNYPAKFAPASRVGGLLTAGMASAVITSGALDQFDSAARAIAQQVVSPEKREFTVPCRPKREEAPDDACARTFFTKIGALLYRRPLTATELEVYVAASRDSAEKVQGFYPGLGIALASMLIAPEVIYIDEPTEKSRGREVLTSYGKASRLSLLLWNSYPDEELLAAAQRGALETRKGLAAQVDRMLASLRLEDGVRNFFDDMLHFEQFSTLAKDGAIYPAFTNKVSDDAREQTLRTIVRHVVHENADYRALFTTRKTFLTNDLGSIYGVRINRPDGWLPYEFPQDSPRAGLLTQISFLALHSHPGRSSATLRGRAIREIFLCQKVPPPPPNVDFSAVENPPKDLNTARARINFHLQNPVCAGCHKITDPIGLSLENFDGAGIYRAAEAGAPIDASGQLDNLTFTDVVGLGAAMRDNPRTSSCLAERLTSYALGREMKSEDRDWLKYVTDQFAAKGYSVKELLRTIATSDAFYTVAVEGASRAAASSSSKGGGNGL